MLSCLFCLLSLPTDLVDLLLKLALELRTDSDSLRVLKFLVFFWSFNGCSNAFLFCSISYIFLLRLDVFKRLILGGILGSIFLRMPSRLALLFGSMIGG